MNTSTPHNIETHRHQEYTTDLHPSTGPDTLKKPGCSFIRAALMALAFVVASAPASQATTIVGVTQCNSTMFTIQLQAFPQGVLVAQLLLSPSGEVILDTSYDFAAQTVVAIRPAGLTNGTYHLNIYLDGVWTADAQISLCGDVNGGEEGVPGGRTKGFWSNKNGQALITEADLQGLRDLCLKNGSGADFNATTKANFRTWLGSASGNNMAYMLSAQLAATYLSVQHGFTNPNATVDGTLTVSALMTYANSLLCADGITRSGDGNRAEQERVKDLLDRINNGH